jgi:hypothetical protein
MDVFLDIRAEQDNTIKAGCELFKLSFHGKPTKDLGDLRFDIFSKRAAAGGIFAGLSRLQHSTLCGFIFSRLEIGWFCKINHWMFWTTDGSSVTKVTHRSLQQTPLHRTIL